MGAVVHKFDWRGNFYFLVVGSSFLRGIYLDDKDIIILSLLVLPMCGIFLLRPDQDNDKSLNNKEKE